MTPENKNEERFDTFLKDSLKQYRQSVPTDFSRRMLDKLQQFQQQEAIKQVILQERILLAAWILLPLSIVILIIIFPGVLLLPMRTYQSLYPLSKEIAANIIRYWQLCITYAITLAVVVYAVYKGLLADI